MKARRPYRPPLSGRAMEMLADAWPLGGREGMVFPSKGGRMAPDMTYAAPLHRLEIPAVAHTFRSSYRDWCAQRTARAGHSVSPHRRTTSATARSKPTCAPIFRRNTVSLCSSRRTARRRERGVLTLLQMPVRLFHLDFPSAAGLLKQVD